MTITLPLDPIYPPQYRFQVKKVGWNGVWSVLPQPKTSPYLGGFFLEEVSRATIPSYGEMTFRYDFGEFDGFLVGTDSSQTFTDDLNLAGKIVRLEMQPGTSDGTTDAGSWKTVWIGVCELQEDTMAPGASVLLGSRRYYCTDLLYAMTRRWYIRKHGYAYTDSTGAKTYYPHAEGHPGYNTRGVDGRIFGNKSTEDYQSMPQDNGHLSALPWFNAGSGPQLESTVTSTYLQYCRFHALTSYGSSPWLDVEVLRHILSMYRPSGSPWFDFQGATDLFSLPSFSWPVNIGETVWDMLSRICDRRRGRGLCYFDFASDASSVYITVNAQTADNISWTSPVDGATNTIFGATENSTTTTVDLVGDHRNISDAFRLGGSFLNTYDEVETLGEQIQVLANLDLNQKSLTRQWSTAEATAFDALTFPASAVYRYDAVYQLFGLNPAWNGTTDDGDSSDTIRIDYRCNDSGAIITPSGSPDTPPDTITTLSDMPLFSAYNYKNNPPVRYDGATSDVFVPDRRQLMVLYNDGNGNYARADEIYNMTVRVVGNWRFEISVGSDLATGTRQFSSTGALDPTKVVIVTGLELPHRIRARTVSTVNSNASIVRKQVIQLPGLHLWIAPTNAIWDLDPLTITGNNIAPLRAAVAGAKGPSDSGDFGTLRDDRARLSAIHALACAWYLTERQTASWALHDCGLLPTFDTVSTDGNSTTPVAYPKLGYLVTTITAGGKAITINAPVTKIVYNHVTGNGITSWLCAWTDADFTA